MTQFTKSSPGAPTSGKYSFGDTVTDNLGIVWQCIAAGIPGSFLASPPYVAIGGTSAVVGAPAGTGTTALEFGNGILRHTRLTLAALPQTITNGASEFTSTKIYDFPEGRILVLGVTASLAPTTTSTLSTTITTGTTGSVALGTVAASNASLTSTMVNLLPATAYTSSTTINVAAAAVTAALAAAAQFDGTATPVDILLNNSIATNSADGTLVWNGTVDVLWSVVGDY